MSAQQNDKTPDVVVHGTADGFRQDVVVGKHNLVADEPVSAGGGDAGPDPYDYLLIALGACTSMTVGLYARRKQFPLENITVSLRHSRIYANDCEECETKEGMLDRIDVEVELTGSLKCGATCKTDGDRREMSGTSHAHIGDQHSLATCSEIVFNMIVAVGVSMMSAGRFSNTRVHRTSRDEITGAN